MVTFDYRVLNGKITEKFGSQKEFAKALGTSERTLSLKLNNKVYFTQKEMIKVIELFGDTTESIEVYFFKAEVQEDEQKAV